MATPVLEDAKEMPSALAGFLDFVKNEVGLSSRPLLFVAIGTIAGVAFGALFPLDLLQNIRFPAGFGFVGLSLGVSYSYHASSRRRTPLSDHARTITTFTILGIAFSCLLHVRYETPYRLSDVKFYQFFTPLAVAVFVYIFWVAFLSLPRLSPFWSASVLAAILVTALFFFFYLYAEVVFITDLTVMLVNLCVLLTLLVLTANFFYSDYFDNITVSVAALILVMSVAFSLALAFLGLLIAVQAGKTAMPVLAATFILLLLVSNLYFAARVALAYRSRRASKGASGGERFEKRVTGTFDWILSFPAVLANYTIYLAPLAVIPYWGISEYFRNREDFPLGKCQRLLALKRSGVLAINAGIVYFVFLAYYDFLSAEFYYGHAFSRIDGVVGPVVWGGLALIASMAVAFCLYGNQSD